MVGRVAGRRRNTYSPGESEREKRENERGNDEMKNAKGRGGDVCVGRMQEKKKSEEDIQGEL